MSEETKERESSPATPSATGLLVPVGTHAKRAWSWNIADVEPSDTERAAAGERFGESSLRYMLWRRSNVFAAMIMAAVSLLFGIVSAIIDISGAEGIKSGKEIVALLIVLLLVAKGFLALTLWRCWLSWRNPGWTKKALRTGWLIALLAPLTICVLPIMSILEYDMGELANAPPIIRNTVLDAMAMFLGLQMFLTGIPSLLSLFPGLLRGSLAVKSLLPGRGFGPAIAVAITPLYAMFLVVILVPLQQFLGSWIFLLGMLCLACGPLVFGVVARRLIAPQEQQSASRAIRAARGRARWFYVIGSVLMVVGLFSRKFLGQDLIGFGKGALIQGWFLIDVAAWFITMICTYSVVASDSVLTLMRESAERAGVHAADARHAADAAPLEEVAGHLGGFDLVRVEDEPGSDGEVL